MRFQSTDARQNEIYLLNNTDAHRFSWMLSGVVIRQRELENTMDRLCYSAAMLSLRRIKSFVFARLASH